MPGGHGREGAGTDPAQLRGLHDRQDLAVHEREQQRGGLGPVPGDDPRLDRSAAPAAERAAQRLHASTRPAEPGARHALRQTVTRPKIGFKIILCDAAQADSGTGKLHMLGAGWTVIGTPTSPHAVALMVQVPWDRATEKLPVRIELLDSDGKPVEMPGAEGPQSIAGEAELEVGRPPGVAHGSPLSAVFALNVAQLPLAPGRYEWRASVDGDTQAESFQVLGQPARQ